MEQLDADGPLIGPVVHVPRAVQVEAEGTFGVLSKPDVGGVRLRVVLEPHRSVPRRDDHPGDAAATGEEGGQLPSSRPSLQDLSAKRSEERRVGKECRARWWAYG